MEMMKGINKTVLIFEDIDNIFQDEKGFYTGVIKWIENSKVPIILTSHLPFKNCEVIKKWEKKGIKIMEIKRKKDSKSALKVKIRLHIIILFEWFIDKYMKEFFESDKENKEKEILIDLENIEIGEDDFSYEEIFSQYSYITTLLKQMNFNFWKILSLLSMHSWDNIVNSIDFFNFKPDIMTKRQDILFQQQLFATSNPNQTFANAIFNSVLPDIESKPIWIREHGSSTDSTSKTDQNSFTPTKEDNDYKLLSKYQKFICNMSEFCYLTTKQLNYEESSNSKNIFDVDLTNKVDINKPENQNIIDEFFIGKSKCNQKLEKNNKIKKSQKQLLEEVEKNLKASDSSENHWSRMTLEGPPGKEENLPYFWLVWKEEKLNCEKTKLNSTSSLYGSLWEASYFHHSNLSLLYNHTKE